MNNPNEIKQILSPIMVAEYYLGQPVKKTGDRFWYKSPFRREKTASFMVSESAFHDFGDGWHGDIIDFVERYYNTNFVNAMKILSQDFGLPENKKISMELQDYLKQKREEEVRIQQAIDNWFNETFFKICDELKTWQKVISHLRQEEALMIAYNEEVRLNILWEIFFNAIGDEDKKIELWKERKQNEILRNKYEK